MAADWYRILRQKLTDLAAAEGFQSSDLRRVSTTDGRQQVRLPIHTGCTLEQGDQITTARVCDVSVGGVGLQQLPDGLVADEPLWLRFSPFDAAQEFSLSGRLVWQKNEAGGLAFDVDGVDLKALQHGLEDNIRHQGCWLSQYNLTGLRQFLAEQLPDYMLPSMFVLLDRIPRTAGGKRDLQALPEPQSPARKTARDVPQTAMEKQLAESWQRLLKKPQVARDDHFFELGGHSLLATKLLSEVGRELQRDIPLKAVFEHPVLWQLASYLDALPDDDPLAVTQSVMMPAEPLLDEKDLDGLSDDELDRLLDELES